MSINFNVSLLIIHGDFFFFFFFNETATTEIYTLSLHDALPILFSHIETNSHITGSFKRLTFSINRPQPTRTGKSVLRVENRDGHTVTIGPRILQAI